MSCRCWGNVADVEVVHGQVLRRDPELRGRLLHFLRQRVRRKALRQRPGGDRERHVADFRSFLHQPRHRPAGAELAVVGMGR